jgi:hypothetical protein
VAKTRSPRYSRTKGANGEREFRDVIREFGFTAERDGQTRVARYSGDPNLDVRHDIPGVHTEVKRQETYLIDKWLSQSEMDSERESRATGIAVESWVCFRKSQQPWRVIVNARWLLAIMREVVDLRREVQELRDALLADSA